MRINGWSLVAWILFVACAREASAQTCDAARLDALQRQLEQQ
jgi:hypothetical protein